MSLTITVRPQGATTGGQDHALPAAGDNGNQEIDTREEAEAALALLPAGSNDVAVVGTRAYTRDELIAIRDGNSASTVPVAAIGVSHGVGLQGAFIQGLNDNGHSGGSGRLHYILGIPLYNNGTQLFLDPSLGVDVGHFGRDYVTPGGEPVKSAFTHGSAVLGADLRLVPPILNGRALISLGLRGSVGGFGTAAGTVVKLPNNCVPGDFGRGECEPAAGPKEGNGGLTGVYDPRQGSARETSGAILGLEIPLALGFRAAQGEWGALEVVAGPKFSFQSLIPKDGGSIDSVGIGGFAGVNVRFGGADSVAAAAAAPVAAPPPPLSDKDGDGVPDATDKCPDVKGTKDNDGCPPFDARVTSSPAAVKAQEKFLVGVAVASSVKVRVSFKDAAGTLNNSNSALVDEGNSKSEFGVPAELKSGKYKLVVTLEDLKTGVKKVEEKDIVIVENVTAVLPGSFAPNQPPTIQNVKVNGMEKLEGVTYVIEGFDKDKKSIGTLNSGEGTKIDKSWTLSEKQGTRIALTAPGTKGFQKEINYVVTLKNKEGHAVWSGSFEVGQAQTWTKKVKPK